MDFTITGPGAGFLFRNSDRNLTLGFDDDTSVTTYGGAITVAVTGAPGFDLTMPNTDHQIFADHWGLSIGTLGMVEG